MTPSAEGVNQLLEALTSKKWICGVCDEALGKTAHCVACWHYAVSGKDVYGRKLV